MSLDLSAASKIKASPEFERTKTLKIGLEMGPELKKEPELSGAMTEPELEPGRG